MYDLGLILRNLREQHGYTQTEVGKKLNVSYVSVGRWEQNAKKPTTERLIELSLLYNVPINYLVGIPLEDTLVIENLTPEQQNLVQAIAREFYITSSGNKPNKISKQQQQIVSTLLQEFSR